MTYIGQASTAADGTPLALPAGTANGDLLIVGIMGGSAVSSSDSRLTLLLQASNVNYMTRVYTGLADAGLSAIPWTANDTIQSAVFVVVFRNLVITDTAQDPVGGGLNSGVTNSVPLVDTPCDYAVAIRWNMTGTVAGGVGSDGAEWTSLTSINPQKASMRALGWTDQTSLRASLILVQVGLLQEPQVSLLRS